MKLKLISALAVSLLSAAPAFAAPVTLDFEGAGEFYFINDYYNGGTNEGGVSGTNYGISFGPAALAFSNDPAFPNYSNAPTPGTVMSAVDGDAAMNVASGFSGLVSFYYSSTADTLVNVYSGLNGTGSVLATFSLLGNAQSGCSDTAFCHWDLASLNIDGVAQSIQFGSTAGVAGFDNVTVNPVPVPAAGWMMLSALGGLGAIVRRKRTA